MIPYRYIIRRIIVAIPTTIGALALIFMVVRVLPADPVSMLIDPAHRSPETIAALTKAMGLDRPLYEQFWIYLLNVFRGDLGYSWSRGRPVMVELIDRLPATLELLIASMLVAILLGIPFGVIGGWKRGTKVDKLVSTITLMGVMMPQFWWALVLILLFYYFIPIFPPPLGELSFGLSVNRITGLTLIDSLLTGNLVAFVDGLHHIILPAIALSFFQLAILTKIQRVEIVEALEADYIKTARAKGVSDRDVVFKHALKNALLATVTQIGLIFGGLMGGSVIIESVFAWPGMGMFAVESIKTLDYNSLQGFVVFTALIFIATNLAVDIVYAIIDPRIRYG